MSAEEYSVEVKDDFIERQAKASPIQALSELIWNALDADATSISIDLENDGLGGLAKIHVRDDGHGLAWHDAQLLSLPRSQIRSHQQSRILPTVRLF